MRSHLQKYRLKLAAGGWPAAAPGGEAGGGEGSYDGMEPAAAEEGEGQQRQGGGAGLYKRARLGEAPPSHGPAGGGGGPAPAPAAAAAPAGSAAPASSAWAPQRSLNPIAPLVRLG